MISSEDIRWADIIFVMEKKYRSRLVAKFSRVLGRKSIHVLDIPDEYKYMDKELVMELEARVGVYLLSGSYAGR